ncbi:MAG TPA: Plug domain-containing protein, partial [Bdellovibrionales bacterium]|nr:Plug domain-containing protein [Bdellovibrionales bacterium]
MRSFILWVLAFAALAVQAQDLDNLSLGDMLDMQSTIATKRSLSTRESPGIVSIVTREEIERSSARDLMEILNMHVPGIYSGTDIEGAAGIGIRGIWGFDSRMLLMLDGIELNEEVFGSMPLGNRYPAEMIDRVEVIRGPGSVIYGGGRPLGGGQIEQLPVGANRVFVRRAAICPALVL